MSTSAPPLRVAIIGMGGYAGAHHNAMLRLEARKASRLVATCDPRADTFTTERAHWQLEARGVRIFTDYLAMLDACAGQIDVLVVPTPIPLHAEMHRAGVERGIAVYLEKPPTLDHAELEAMIAVDQPAEASGRTTLVGFNFIVEPSRLTLKQRLLAGEFGPLQEARLHARWARGKTYFTRNSWAGRLLGPDGRPVLDSCFGNAMAHFVHDLLFWAGGPDLHSWADFEHVKAELYRAHAIEGPDTFFVHAPSSRGVNLRFALTHACHGESLHAETLHCARASLTYIVGSHWQINWHDGRTEREDLPPFDALVQNHLDYYHYLQGHTPRPATRLADSRPFVHLNNLAYLSAGEITPFPPDRVEARLGERDQTPYLHVEGLDPTLHAFLDRGHWPSEHGWPRQKNARLVTTADLPRLHETLPQLIPPPSP